MNNNISIQDRSKLFAIRAIKAYTELNKRHFDDAGKVLAKQFLRASTSIGANLAEGEFAQSRADFISKYSIALKEALKDSLKGTPSDKLRVPVKPAIGLI
jgi:four helix bundle protein